MAEDYSSRTDQEKINQPAEKEIPLRAQKNKLYFWCYKLCSHWVFTLTITVLIVTNTIVLALERYPEDPSTLAVQDILNEFFTWSFVAELIIKIIGLGVREYARDSFNLFDALVVVLSLIDIIVTTAIGNSDQMETLSAFRGVRLLRVFKLARNWSSFRKILTKIIDTMKHTAIFSVLLLMFALIFSLLGMELFGHNIRYYDENPVHLDDPKGQSPRPNFDNLGWGFTAVFAIAIGDDWNYAMGQAFRSHGVIAIIFYPVVYCSMTLILLSLFLAILLEKFAIDESSENNQGANDQESRSVSHFSAKVGRICGRMANSFEKKCPCCFLKEFSDDEQVELEDTESLKSSYNQSQHPLAPKAGDVTSSQGKEELEQKLKL